MDGGAMCPEIRKRLKRIESTGQARFITCSCSQRLQLLANPHIRDAFVKQVILVHRRSAFRLLGWVVMLRPDWSKHGTQSTANPTCGMSCVWSCFAVSGRSMAPFHHSSV